MFIYHISKDTLDKLGMWGSLTSRPLSAGVLILCSGLLADGALVFFGVNS